MEYQKKPEAGDKRSGKRKGKEPQPPTKEPRDKEQANLTDPDSLIMSKSKHSKYRQPYNPQAVVDAEGSQLILGHE